MNRPIKTEFKYMFDGNEYSALYYEDEKMCVTVSTVNYGEKSDVYGVSGILHMAEHLLREILVDAKRNGLLR
ncbi:MAG: hypothetical protein WCD42_10710 [Rhizomicrobium sp.]